MQCLVAQLQKGERETPKASKRLGIRFDSLSLWTPRPNSLRLGQLEALGAVVVELYVVVRQVPRTRSLVRLDESNNHVDAQLLAGANMGVGVCLVTAYERKVSPGHGGLLRRLPIQDELVRVREHLWVGECAIQAYQLVFPLRVVLFCALDPCREHSHGRMVPHRLHHQAADIGFLREVHAIQASWSVAAQHVTKHQVNGQRHRASTSLEHGIEEG
mmetsp:Transcript_5775/g.15992  ORF Transcript_5775/g.15992 Transcript_5775/m.15992 type:complete len:216 (+) Transcript_5775:18-665(+)